MGVLFVVLVVGQWKVSVLLGIVKFVTFELTVYSCQKQMTHNLFVYEGKSYASFLLSKSLKRVLEEGVIGLYFLI